MARILNTSEKKEFINGFESVKNAKEFVMHNGKPSRTATGTKAYEFNFFMKTYDYILMDCGLIVKVKKPKIFRDVYFDDEGADPFENADKFDVWRDYNLRMEAPNRKFYDYYRKQERTPLSHLMALKPFIYELPNCDYNNCGQFVCEYLESIDKYEIERRRYLDRDELEQFLKCLDALTAKYVKRLESYFKRYGNQIYSCGYWANR